MKCFRPEGHGQEVDNKAIKTVDGIFWSKTKMGDTMVYVGVYQVVNLKKEGASQDGLGQFFSRLPVWQSKHISKRGIPDVSSKD